MACDWQNTVDKIAADEAREAKAQRDAARYEHLRKRAEQLLRKRAEIKRLMAAP